MLAAKMHDGLVLGVGTLFDHVVLDHAHAAIRQVDAVTRVAARPVDDPAIGDGRRQSAAFDLVPDMGVVEVAVVDHERLYRAHVQVVRVAVAGAVEREL